ncbi:MAG: GNAT family N-acetyltransferase, partial [Haloarculaceae archaeon]
MSIEVRNATRDDLEQWNSYVDQSPTAGLFHRREAIEVLARHADARVHHLVGFKGQEPVGIFPVFELRKGPTPSASVSTAFSPPPDLRVPYLGPALLNMDKLKQRKAERRHKRFVAGSFEWIDEEIAPRYAHVRVGSDYPDMRPLTWEGFEATPTYTYHVDLTVGEDDLLDSFSSDARSNIRDGRDRDDVTVREEGRAAVGEILQRVRERYESQGIAFHLPDELVEDLYDRLPDGSIRPYVCRVDGEFVGGILAYEHDDAIYRWQGGVRVDADVDVAINDLLDWQVMVDG